MHYESAMKKLFLLLILTAFFTFPTKTFANAGFEERASNVTVHIIQDPISPLVGEKVKMYFNLKDESNFENPHGKVLANFPAKLSVIDTYYGDATKDKEILSKDMKTDINGNFAFEYTFHKENYYEIELAFEDKDMKERELGFLVQPRKSENSAKPQVTNYILALCFGALVSFLTLRLKSK